MTDLRILTVRQPWAGLITGNGRRLPALKDVENRTRRTSYRGPLIIHSSRVHESGARELLAIANRSDAAGTPVSRDAFFIAMGWVAHEKHFGALLGLVDLVDCIPYEQCDSPWRMAPPEGRPGWCWKLANPRPFAEPIPSKGAQGLWAPEQLDAEARAMLERELERVGVH